MKRSRLSFAVPAFCLVASFAQAQAVDWKSLGKPLSDDTTPMVERYVYTQEETTTDRNVGIDKPVLTPGEVDGWLAQHIPQMYDLRAHNYDTNTIKNQTLFTPKGYAEYIASLNAAQLPLVVKEKRFNVSAVVTDPATIAAKGVRTVAADPAKPEQKEGNVYVWQLEVPVTLNYKGMGMNDQKSYKVLLKIELVRIPMREDGTLLTINGWRLEEYKPAVPNATPATAQ